MFLSREELIEEIEGHIRRFGGRFGEWSIGTAKDCRGPFFERHLVADLGDGLTYREAFTTTAAQAVVDHLVNDRGLQFERDAVPEPGRVVFVYRPGKEAISHQLSTVSKGGTSFGLLLKTDS